MVYAVLEFPVVRIARCRLHVAEDKGERDRGVGRLDVEQLALSPGLHEHFSNRADDRLEKEVHPYIPLGVRLGQQCRLRTRRPLRWFARHPGPQDGGSRALHLGAGTPLGDFRDAGVYDLQAVEEP